MNKHPVWYSFWQWFTCGGGWQSLAALTYLVICLFDFVIVPAWVGVVRAMSPSITEQILLLAQLEPLVQQQVLSVLTYQHEPLTLRGGGLFHISFGALLTGTAINSPFNRRRNDNSNSTGSGKTS